MCVDDFHGVGFPASSGKPGSTRKVADASTREELTYVGECLELECISGWIQEEHRGLLPWLTLEPCVRFDDEPCAPRAKTLSQRLPLILSKYHPKMGNRHIMTVDRIIQVPLARDRWFEVRDDLMAE